MEHGLKWASSGFSGQLTILFSNQLKCQAITIYPKDGLNSTEECIRASQPVAQGSILGTPEISQKMFCYDLSIAILRLVNRDLLMLIDPT